MSYLIYDDECDFCCSVVRKLTALIDRPEITYIPLKSPKGKQLISDHDLHDVNSVIYIDEEDETYIKAIAVLRVFRGIKTPYSLIYLFNIFPDSILNAIYDFIAKNRMKIYMD